MSTFRQPDKSVSRSFEQNGVYIGNVTRTDEASQQVYVEIPRYVAGFEFGPLNVASTDLPVVGDSVACLFLENKQNDIMILGVIKSAATDVNVTPVVATSSTRPDAPRTGTILYETDTEDLYVWTDSAWVGLFDAQNDSVVLGTDTVGDYVSTVTAGTGISISAGSGTGEGSTPTLAIGQDVATSATPSFSRVTSTVATGTAPLTVASTTLVSNLNADLLDGLHGAIYAPTGMIVQFAAASSPGGWLLCDGSLVLKSSYPDLWALLGSTYGSATSTQFYLPDLRGRIPVGLDNMGGSDAGRLSVSNTLGGTGGEEKHLLIVSEMPSHTHLQNAHTHTQDAHTHTQDAHTHSAGSYDGLFGITNALVTDGGGGNVYQGLYAGGSPNARINTNGATATNQNTTATNQNTTATNQNTGGDGEHNNMQPYILMNYIIKT